MSEWKIMSLISGRKVFQLSAVWVTVLAYTFGLGNIFTLLTSLALTFMINVLIHPKVLHFR